VGKSGGDNYDGTCPGRNDFNDEHFLERSLA
jgi:hypothetical protein